MASDEGLQVAARQAFHRPPRVFAPETDVEDVADLLAKQEEVPHLHTHASERLLDVVVQELVAQDRRLSHQAHFQRDPPRVYLDRREPPVELPAKGADLAHGSCRVKIAEAGVHHARRVAPVPLDGARAPGTSLYHIHGEHLEPRPGAAPQEGHQVRVEVADDRRLHPVIADPENEQLQTAFLEDLLLQHAVVAQAAGSHAVHHDAVLDAFLRRLDEMAG